MKKLTIPCSYQGGKQRVAKQITNIIQQYINNENVKFYDLCCGSGAISIELVNQGFDPNNIIMVDKSPWGLFWKQIGDGSFDIKLFKQYINNIPKDVAKIQQHIKELYKNPTLDNLTYEFLLLQSASFGSKGIWWEGNRWCTSSFRNYWLPTETSKRRSPVNPMMPMPNTLYQRIKDLSECMIGVKGYYNDCIDIHIESNSIIYIDPPYVGTSGYGYNFDYMSFIDTYKNTNIILLSEGEQLSDISFNISTGRSKGGISGDRKKKANEEWLNVFT